MTTPTQRLSAAEERLKTTALAAHRARQACNGQHADLQVRLTRAVTANTAHAEAIFHYGEAHAAAHQKEPS